MEAGWVVTEVGRQPWIVYRVLLVNAAVTPSSGVTVTLAVILVLYAILTLVSIGVPMLMSRRWRREGPADEDAEQVPYGPSPGDRRPRGRRARGRFARTAPRGLSPGAGRRCEIVVNPSPETIAVAAILFVVLAAYALFGGADFGGGIWDLIAGGPRARRRPTGTIRRVHHPGLGSQPRVAGLHPGAAVDGVPARVRRHHDRVVRAAQPLPAGNRAARCGFAFGRTPQRMRVRQFTGATFAASSLITPFFMGTVVGAVATGQVPVHPTGNVPAAWTSLTALLTGFLFVAACAYVSAVFLVLEARQRGRRALMRYFALRATAAGAVTGGLAGATFAELSASSPYVFHRLTGISLPLVAVSIAAGVAVLGMLWLRWCRR